MNSERIIFLQILEKQKLCSPNQEIFITEFHGIACDLKIDSKI